MFLVWAVPYILLASIAVAADFSAKIIRVLDGDTLEVPHSNRPERIRLSGINGPALRAI
jgi:endonuclease YncB( thermonuclease family)